MYKYYEIASPKLNILESIKLNRLKFILNANIDNAYMKGQQTPVDKGFLKYSN